MGWEKYRAFVKQLTTEISRVERPSELGMTAFATGSRGIITVEDFAKGDAFMELKARVAGPRGESRDVALKQVAPRRYQAEFPLWGKGRYQVSVAGVGPSEEGGKPRSEQAFGGFAVPYSPEYLRFKSDPLVLKQIAERTGGRMLTPADMELFKPERSPRESSKPVFDWFLLVLACLVPLDVGLRRVQLDWSVIAGWFGFGRRRESTPTMGALLERKKQITVASAPKEGLKPASMPAPAQPKSPKEEAPKTAPTDSKQSPPTEAGEKNMSTTERLLARKRKRKEEEQD
jgi:hypothetical protein